MNNRGVHMKEVIKRIVVILCFFIPLFCFIDILNTNEKIYVTGIKNKGIDYIIPTRVTKETYEKLGLLMKEEDRKEFEACYKEEKNHYALGKCNKKEIEPIIEEAEILNYMFYNALQNKSTQDETLGIKNASNVYNVLKGRNEKQRVEYLKNAKKQINNFSDKTKKDYAYKSIVVEESKFGISQNTLRDNYISKKVIRMIIDTLLLILVSIIELIMIKNKERKTIQNILLLIILEIYSLKHNLTVNLIILGITILIMTLIYLFKNNLTKTPLEEKLEKKMKKMNPSMTWIIITILFTMVNQIIYGLYTSYHIFVGINAEKVVYQINGLEANTVLVLLLGMILIHWKKKYTKIERKVEKNNRKVIRKEESKQEEKSNKTKSKSKKKKKKK